MESRPLPGDIVLYPTTPSRPLSSRVVAAGEMLLGAGEKETLYSHAGVLATLTHDYEAKWPRSGLFKIDDTRPFEIWRVTGLTLKQRNLIIHWCETHRGEWYNLLGLITFGHLGLPHTAVCSQFVGRAYKYAGINIPMEGRDLLSPDAISDFKKAHRIYSHIPKGN